MLVCRAAWPGRACSRSTAFASSPVCVTLVLYLFIFWHQVASSFRSMVLLFCSLARSAACPAGGQRKPRALQPCPEHVRAARGRGNFQEASDSDEDGQGVAVGGLLQPGHPGVRESGKLTRQRKNAHTYSTSWYLSARNRNTRTAVVYPLKAPRPKIENRTSRPSWVYPAISLSVARYRGPHTPLFAARRSLSRGTLCLMLC